MMRVVNIRDVFPTLKITYENGLLFEEPIWLGQMGLSGVEFNKKGRYGGCVFSPKNELELMFTVLNKQGRLHVKEIFGRFLPFVCSIDEFVPSIMGRRRTCSL